jgi:hypothetical protein
MLLPQIIDRTIFKKAFCDVESAKTFCTKDTYFVRESCQKLAAIMEVDPQVFGKGLGSMAVTESDLMSHAVADLFTPLNRELTYQSSTMGFVRPKDDNQNGPWEFQISSVGEEFLNCSSLRLWGKFKVVNADGTDITSSTQNVSICNLAPYALFPNCDVKINGISDTNLSSHLANYKAVLECYMSCNKWALDHWQRALFVPDSDGAFDDTTKFVKKVEMTEDDKKKAGACLCPMGPDTGFQIRSHMIRNGRSVDFMIPLNHEIAQLDRLLLPGVVLELKFLKAPDSFVIWSPDANASYKIKVEELRLYYKTLKLQSQLTVDIERKLAIKPAIYPINKTIIKNQLIATGSSNYYWTNMYEGLLPKMIIITMVKNSSFNGNYAENPFHFQPFNLKEIYLTINGATYPQESWKPDWDNNIYMREYSELLDTLGITPNDVGNMVTHTNFKDGLFAFAADLSPEGCSGFHHHPLQRGNINLTVAFKTPLAQPVCILSYAIYDTELYLDKDRQIKSINLT